MIALFKVACVRGRQWVWRPLAHELLGSAASDRPAPDLPATARRDFLAVARSAHYHPRARYCCEAAFLRRG